MIDKSKLESNERRRQLRACVATQLALRHLNYRKISIFFRKNNKKTKKEKRKTLTSHCNLSDCLINIITSL